jgi:hypothetical protein
MKTIFFSQDLWELAENGSHDPEDQGVLNALAQAQ